MFKLNDEIRRILYAPDKMSTLCFLREVLRGTKKLMKVSDLTGIPKIPRIPEINARLLWEEIKEEAQITIYFPSVYLIGSRIPDRNYMFNVNSTDLCHASAKLLQ